MCGYCELCLCGINAEKHVHVGLSSLLSFIFKQEVLRGVVVVLEKGRFKGREIQITMNKGTLEGLMNCTFLKPGVLEYICLLVLIRILKMFVSLWPSFMVKPLYVVCTSLEFI